MYGKYSTTIQLDQKQDDKFNKFLKESLVIQVEEARANPQLRDRLYHWITDENIEIRQMQRDGTPEKTYCNFTFTSNRLDAVKIEDSDRRFTVTPYVEDKLKDVLTDEEIDELIEEFNKKVAAL